jgi:electron-transferring-flavoprotein dehydrogenase
LRVPAPPPFRNRGNEVVSVSALARFQQREAEAGGAYVLTETAADQLIVQEGRVVGVRSGAKGRGKDGQPLANFEPGTDIRARATVLAEGAWGHLTEAAVREFDLAAGREPQVWELGVKEVWRVRRPLDRVIHTLGPWPLKLSAAYGQIGGAWIYPMKDARTGADLVSIGLVVDLDYADATTSAHDLLQTFKLHPLVRAILGGGERLAWGAKALPGGGYWSVPRLTMPGALIVGDAGGLVDTVALKGLHHAITSGMLAAEAIHAALAREEGAALEREADGALAREDGAGLASYERAIAASSVGSELYRVRNARQPLQRGLLRGGPVTGMMIATGGRFPGGRWSWQRDASRPVFVGDTRSSYPRADGRYTFEKLSSVFISGNATRDDAPDHIRIQRRVPREIAEAWSWMCPASVYEIPPDAPTEGPVDVIVNHANCIQCGAITAKGGRLTVPEGGDGPQYQLL